MKQNYAILDYFIIVFSAAALAVNFFFKPANILLQPIFWIAVTGSLPTLIAGIKDLFGLKITIDVFNSVALVFSAGTKNFSSTAFIVLMLASARLLDRFTEGRSRRAIEELLKLKPQTARRERNGTAEKIPVAEIRVGDILVVETGERVPADGKIIFGEGLLNEAPVTGESRLARKTVGDFVWSLSLNEGSTFKMKAEKVGKESLMERIVALVAEASRRKSHSEKLADRAAGYFLPLVLLAALGTYVVTKNSVMAVAILLVACADDLAVSIPLAVTAALGGAARRGVIIKGGSWLEALAKVKTLILDKTGTLTYGEPRLADSHFIGKRSAKEIWQFVAAVEKYSHHPIGKALFSEAKKRIEAVPEPERFEVLKGKGVFARWRGHEIYEGDEDILDISGVELTNRRDVAKKESEEHAATVVFLVVDKHLEAIFILKDLPRPEAKESLKQLKEAGIQRTILFSGDNEEVTKRIASELGVDDFQAAMSPEDKMRGLEALLETAGPVGMVGDGINDAPALARADVGIAMGAIGTEVAIETADVVLMTDNLARLTEMIGFGRDTLRIIRGDAIIWLLTNAVGFWLVWTGVAGLTLAAFYNFVTDFLPLLNSARLFWYFKEKIGGEPR